MDEKRPFRVRLSNKTVLNLTIRKPTLQESTASDEEYSSVFNRSLMGGMPTRAKLNLVLKKKDLVDQADFERMQTIRVEVNRIDDAIKSNAKRLDGKDEKAYTEYDQTLQNEIKELQDKRGPLMQEFNELRSANESMFTHTADTRAEQAQRNFLLACTVEYGTGNVNKAGSRVWDSLEDILKEMEAEKYQRSLYEYMMLEQDLPSDGDLVFGIVEDQAEKPADPAAPAVPATETASEDETADTAIRM